MYESVLEFVRDFDRGPDAFALDPDFVTYDFERAEHLALESVFPNATVHGCNFRLAHSVIHLMNFISCEPAT